MSQSLQSKLYSFQELLKTPWMTPILLSIFVALSLFVFKDTTVSRNILSVFNSVENALLDKRLLLRAQRFSPSKDVVVVALDRKTQNYAKIHPEIGINNLTVPRKRFADIVNYISRQEPKAIVFDIEFINETDSDTELVEAIKNAGNVYSAFRMATPLSEFMVNKRIPRKHLKNVLEQSGHNTEESFQTDFCINGYYDQGYAKKPAFLNSLIKNSIPMTIKSTDELITFKNFTYCNSGSTAQHLLNHLKGIGVSSVKYDSDAMIRKVLSVYRGYRGKFYANLSLKPALDNLNIKNISYSNKKLLFSNNKETIKTHLIKRPQDHGKKRSMGSGQEK